MNTDQEILTKAIQKAIDDGWTLPGYKMYKGDIYEVTDLRSRLQYGEFELHIDGGYNEVSVNQVIFNHDFAKALWGEDERKPEPVANSQFMTTVFKRDWRYHLQQMVIADDPIKYLGEHI
jgi:hypothetical protein